MLVSSRTAAELPTQSLPGPGCCPRAGGGERAGGRERRVPHTLPPVAACWAPRAFEGPQAHPQCWIPHPPDPGLCRGKPQFPGVHLGFWCVCACMCVHVHTPALPISRVCCVCGLLRTGQHGGVMVGQTWGAGQLVGERVVTA